MRRPHIGQSAYLLEGEDSLLFDTLSPASTDRILAELDEELADGLDYLLVSHPDVPHAGNAHPILKAYPDAELVASSDRSGPRSCLPTPGEPRSTGTSTD